MLGSRREGVRSSAGLPAALPKVKQVSDGDFSESRLWRAAHAQARSQKPSPTMDPWAPKGLGPLGPEGTWALGI